jgi:hypothetical protein
MSDLPHGASSPAAHETASRPAREAPRPRLEALHLLVTYRCTFACDHCFVWGSPQQEGTMTLAQLCDVIDQAAAAGCSTVYFEGGEPLLVYPVVLAAARHAREAGLAVGVVTNCFWAESLDDALVWLAPFAGLGVADLSLSSYAYFTEELAQETHLRNAVVAARQLDLPVAVLEVGAPAALADLDVACGTPGAIMYKGRGGGGGRAPHSPARHAHLVPLRRIRRPGPLPRGLRRQPHAVPGHQHRQRVAAPSGRHPRGLRPRNTVRRE